MEEFSYTYENPWKGLFAYREGEILYGRDNDIRDLTQYVLRDKYTLLYGKSGIGKSSILNAAIIPALRRHGYVPIALRLSHKNEHYLCQIQKAIEETLGSDCIHEELPQAGGDETLYEYLHRHTFWDKKGNRVKLFLMFDQFEEIFTLQSDESKKKEFFVQLASQCNDIKPDYLQALNSHSEELTIKQLNPSQEESLDDIEFELPDLDSADYIEDNEIRMIFTIREDFLSEFDYYASSIPSFRNNRYFLRPINEEQAAQIIMRPCPGLVNEQDAWLIISKVTKREDFSIDGNPEVIVDSAVLSLYLSRLYDARPDNGPITKGLIELKGGEIISEFYKDALSAVSQPTADYLEEWLLTGQGRRDNITVYDAKHDGHITEEELHTLIEEKKILRCFNYAGDLRIEFVHDILCDVAAAHREERRIESQQQEERRRLLEQRNEDRRKNRKRLTIAIGIPVFIALITFVYYLLNYMPVSRYYAGYTTQDGFPVGVGPKLNLHGSDIEKLPVYYKLTRKGLLENNPFIEVEIFNRRGEHTTNILVESAAVSLAEAEGNDRNARKFATIQRQISSMKFERDENGNILRQVAYGIDRKALYSIQYSRIPNSETENTTMYWMTFIDPDGKTMKVRDNGLDRMRMMTTDGYTTLVQFFSESGTPQKNSRDAYGYRYTVNSSEGFRTAISTLDEYGDSIAGSTLTFEKFDSFNRWTIANEGKAVYDTNRIIYSISDRTDSLILDENSKLVYRSEKIDGKFLYTFLFNKNGTLLENKGYSMASGVPTLFRSVSNKYGKHGKTVERIIFDATDTIPYRSEIHKTQMDTISVVYLGGKSLDTLALINNREGYCRIDTIITKKSDSTKVVTVFFYTITSGNQKCIIQEDLTYNNKNLIRYVKHENGIRVKSYEYEYENGIRTGRHVIGLTGKIIRCPAWDEEGLCYYRMKYVRDFNGNIVAKKAINEWGEESQLTLKDGIRTTVSVVAEENIKQADSISKSTIYGTGRFRYSVYPADNTLSLPYIHITDTNGLYYVRGLRDGDIVLKKDKEKFIVARIMENGDIKRREILIPKCNKEGTGAEMYHIFLTKDEMDTIKNKITK